MTSAGSRDGQTARRDALHPIRPTGADRRRPQPVVRLSLPASPRFLAAARVVAASLGAESGLSVDDLEDLRLGVNELVSLLVEARGARRRVDLEFERRRRRITVSGARRRRRRRRPRPTS